MTKTTKDSLFKAGGYLVAGMLIWKLGAFFGKTIAGPVPQK